MKYIPKCTVIVSVYKDTQSLDLILESLERQTILPQEVVITEDGDSKEMSEYIKTAKNKFLKYEIVHLSQEDNGWRKNVALNQAVVVSKYEYLIFIDGDCIPFDTFIENHLMQSEKGIQLAGKRVELGKNMSESIRERKVIASNLSNNYWGYLIKLLSEKTRHLEDIIYIPYDSFIAPYIKRRVDYIIGCNWSCFKEDFLKINGFDESYVLPSIGEDVDLTWRFRGMGMEHKSCRNNANIMHLYHKKRFGSNEGDINNSILKKNLDAKKYFCDNGIVKVNNA